MKKILSSVISLVASIAVITPVTALAVTATPDANQKPNETLSQRIEKNKTKFAIKLGEVETAKIKTKCKASQVISKALAVQVTKKNTSRTETYTAITKSVTDAAVSLKAEGKDTKTLETQITELSTKIEKYNTDLALYQTSLSDLSEVDCATDPTGFKSALEAARDARKTVAEDVIAIRTYINTTIKTTLKELDSAKPAEVKKENETTSGEAQ